LLHKILLCLALGPLPVCAQSSSILIGARSTGLGNATSCLSDEWSILNNPGGLSAVRKTTIAFSHFTNPSFQPFDRSAVSVSLPIGSSTAGISLFKFGDDLYSEQIASAAFSNKLGIASLGLRINYIQYAAKDFGTIGVFSISFGGIASVSKTLSIGAYITNINQPLIKRGDNAESIPTRVAVGYRLKMSQRIFLTSEVEKEIEKPILFKTGLCYDSRGKFFFSTGFNLNPNAAFLGAGFRPRRLGFEYGMAYNFTTGLYHQVSASYQFLKR
jgi:hypothetical protein